MKEKGFVIDEHIVTSQRMLEELDRNPPDYMSPELQRWLALYRAARKVVAPPPMSLKKKKPKPRNWRLDP